MKVKDVMTQDVKTVGFDTPLKDVARTLAEARISGLPVVSAAGRVVGVVTEADILYKERGQTPQHGGLFGLLLSGDDLEAEAKLNARTAGESMSAPAITIGPGRPLAEAASKMLEERVNRLPVVDDDGKLVGIVTRADLVKAFLRPDEDIASEIRDEVILRTLWIAPERVSIKVERGEVTLAGRVESELDAELVAQFAQRVPGVVSVLSKLSWEPSQDGNGRKRKSVFTH